MLFVGSSLFQHMLPLLLDHINDFSIKYVLYCNLFSLMIELISDSLQVRLHT